MSYDDHTPDDRLRAVQRGLRARAQSAGQTAAKTEHPEAAAALRGKRTAYREAADMIETVLRGERMHAKYQPDGPIMCDTAGHEDVEADYMGVLYPGSSEAVPAVSYCNECATSLGDDFRPGPVWCLCGTTGTARYRAL